MNYNALTLTHFANPAHSGVLDGGAVRRGAAGSRAWGTWVQFDIRVASSAQGQRIECARFLAYACPHIIAAADWIAREAMGRTPAPVLPETTGALRERFAMPIEKLGRLLILEDAWIAAVSSPYRL